MSMTEALNLPLSFSDLYYDSEAWQQRKKELELDNKIQEALFKQLANVQIQLNNLQKLLAHH